MFLKNELPIAILIYDWCQNFPRPHAKCCFQIFVLSKRTPRCNTHVRLASKLFRSHMQCCFETIALDRRTPRCYTKVCLVSKLPPTPCAILIRRDYFAKGGTSIYSTLNMGAGPRNILPSFASGWRGDVTNRFGSGPVAWSVGYSFLLFFFFSGP